MFLVVFWWGTCVFCFSFEVVCFLHENMPPLPPEETPNAAVRRRSPSMGDSLHNGCTKPIRESWDDPDWVDWFGRWVCWLWWWGVLKQLLGLVLEAPESDSQTGSSLRAEQNKTKWSSDEWPLQLDIEKTEGKGGGKRSGYYMVLPDEMIFMRMKDEGLGHTRATTVVLNKIDQYRPSTLPPSRSFVDHVERKWHNLDNTTAWKVQLS